MAKEVTTARERKAVDIINTRNSLLRTMARSMVMARNNDEMERIYKAADGESKRLAGVGISRTEASRALYEEIRRT